MKKSIIVMALAGGLATSALAQHTHGGVPVGRAAEMAAPNYATKGLNLPRRSLPPRPPGDPAAITYNITFADPGGPYASYYPAITASLQGAGAEWNRRLVGAGSLEVEVIMEPSIPTANGGSVTSGFVRNNGSRDIFEQGAARDSHGHGPECSGGGHSDTHWHDLPDQCALVRSRSPNPHRPHPSQSH